jgi:hypothetical protein
MRAPETVLQAEPTSTGGSEVKVDFWADSVGEAGRQLGFVVGVGIVVHLASSLASHLATVLR